MEEIEKVDLSRYICHFKGNKDQQTLLFVCGIHGNEPMSVLAMEEVSKEIKTQNIRINGTFIGIRGNIKALNVNERYIDYDLNRIWFIDKSNEKSEASEQINELAEKDEILSIINDLIHDKKQNEVIFFDLHTTSSPSVPFITINDTISNRTIAKKYPLATVFGIEEFLNGPLLSYINELGFNAVGFEGGQHIDPNSKENHKAFIWLSLANEGLIDPDLIQVKKARESLKALSKDAYKFFEITYRYEVLPQDHFKMNKGFNNFQSIKKNIPLALSNENEIISKWNNRIFMPLYQSKGDDGFFIIRRIPSFFLGLSKFLRRYNIESFLTLLPGVAIFDKKKHILVVNNNVARLLRNEIFHLFGFRQKIRHSKDLTLYIRREKQ